ncbi:MAG: tetratricopeptide repeat protein [Verrucomicrobiae bacterium]|nr:tetratricopeptide repeat protein [Verrucomicrobiae bacterium]
MRWASFGCLAITTLLFSAEFGRSQDQPEDFAEIYLDRIFPPNSKLDLRVEGKERAEALAHYARGLSLEAQDRREEAVQSFREVLRIDPGAGDLARQVAAMLAESGQRDAGRQVLEEAFRNRPESAEIAIALSEYLATFFPNDDAAKAEAMRLAVESTEKHPSEPAAYEHLVKMYLVARKPGEARAVLEKALARDEPNPVFWLQIGKLAQRIWPLNPDQSPAPINQAFEKALQKGQNRPEIQEQVGDYFHDTRQPERALQIFEALVKAYPDHLGARQKLARVYGALGRDDDVIATLNEVVAINPQDADTHRELGRLYLGREDFQDAIVHFREAMKLTSGTPEEYDAIGRMIIFGAQMPEEAIAFLQRGAYLHPSEPQMPYLLTFAFAQLKRYAEALPWFEKTLTLASQSQPDLIDASFYFRYAAATERAGNIDEATRLFRTCMDKLGKEDSADERVQGLRAETYNYLGYMWLENDMNIDEAGELIKEALALSPESGAILDSYGWFLFKKGRFEDAKRELLKSESLVEEPDGVIYDHLGQTCYALGDQEKAVEYLKKAVELEPDNKEFQERLAKFETIQPPKPVVPDAPPKAAPAPPAPKGA